MVETGSFFYRGEGAGVEGHRQASTDVRASDRLTEISPTHLKSVDEESSDSPFDEIADMYKLTPQGVHPDPDIVPYETNLSL